jgi:hypothetical protein
MHAFLASPLYTVLLGEEQKMEDLHYLPFYVGSFRITTKEMLE